MRNTEIYRALDEVFEIAREAGIRAEVSHIKLSGDRLGAGGSRAGHDRQGRAEGLDVTQDQYAYTASARHGGS